MSQPGISNSDVAALIKIVNSNTLLNRQLQAICGAFGQARGGVKAELRARVINCEFVLCLELDLTSHIFSTC